MIFFDFYDIFCVLPIKSGVVGPGKPVIMGFATTFSDNSRFFVIFVIYLKKMTIRP